MKDTYQKLYPPESNGKKRKIMQFTTPFDMVEKNQDWKNISVDYSTGFSELNTIFNKNIVKLGYNCMLTILSLIKKHTIRIME